MQCTNHVHCTRRGRVGMHGSEVTANHENDHDDDDDDDDDDDGGTQAPTNTEALKVNTTQSVNNNAEGLA